MGKLSPAQRRFLEKLPSSPQYVDWRSLPALKRRGYIRVEQRWIWLTDAGRAALSR